MAGARPGAERDTKTLVLMRHAKAEVGTELGDHARALAGRGRRQSSSQGERLAAAAGPFDVALVSGAQRTRETYELLAQGSAHYPPAHIVDELYNASVRRLLQLLRQLDESAGRVLVVGHEPTMSTAAYMLHDSVDQFTQQLAFGIPTATACVLDVAVPWAELDRHAGHVRAVLRPGD